MSNSQMIQSVFDCVEPFLPEDWNKMVLYAEYDSSSYSIEFYVKARSAYVKCFDLPGVSRKALLEAFSEMDRIICSDREGLSGKHLWTNMTMTVEDNGKVKVDYGYEDLTEVAYSHKKEWKKKYLV